MKYIITRRPAQVILKRHATPGIDWGVDRKLLAVRPDGAMLVWWTGHTTWICHGESGHVPGELIVQLGRDTQKSLDSERAGCTRLVQLLGLPVAQTFIRNHFIDDDWVIVALDPRGTIDIKEAK